MAFAATPLPLSRIMVIGDSIQAGTKLTNAHDLATHRLQRYGNVVVHNFSSPGAAMVDRPFLPGMNHARESVSLLDGFFGIEGVLITVGINDWGASVPVRVFGSVYAAFIDAIPARIKVACMGPIWSIGEGAANANGETKADFRAMVAEVCAARGAAVLDALAAIPHDPAYFADGVHPNRRGHRAMGDFFIHELRKLGWIAT